MTNLQFISVNNLPNIAIKGAFYVLPTGEYFVGKSDGTYLKLSDIEFLTTLPSDGVENKIYVVNDGTSPKIYIYYNNQFVNLLQGIKVNATDVLETSEKVFLTLSQRAQIGANTQDINSLTLRVIELEGNTSTESSDEKVKLNTTDTSGYLEEKIDDVTIRNVGGKLAVPLLNDIIVSANDINQLSGVKSNLQAQINNLSSVGNYTLSIPTFTELVNVTDMSEKDLVIVVSDENYEDKTTMYVYNGTDWNYSGEFKGGEIRDFATNPLDLSNETTNILPKSKYEKPIASEINVTDTNNVFNGTNVEEILHELFQLSNDAKRLVATSLGTPVSVNDTFTQIATKITQLKTTLANAITEKGVVTYPYNNLLEMANKVLTIPNISIEGTVKKTPIEDVSSLPHQIHALLENSISLSDVTTTLMEYVNGASNLLHHHAKFEAINKDEYEPNASLIFNGKLKLANNQQLLMDELANDITGDGYVFTKTINTTEFDNFSGFKVVEQ